MELFSPGMRTQQSPTHDAGVPILVKLWQEDEVWNASAFDLPIAVFGNTFDEARENFEQALASHFELLNEMGRAKGIIDNLRLLADEHGFYEERVKSNQTVTRFEVPSELEACLA